MLIGQFGSHTSTWGTLDETFHDEERLIDILDGTSILANGRSDGVETDRTTLELIDNGEQDLVVNLIKTILVDIKGFERHMGYLQVDASVTLHLRKVAHTTQQRIGNTGRST